MKTELDKELCNKYPDIFKDRHSNMSLTAMCWGFQHGDGWYKIIDDLCKKLTVIKNITGIGVSANTVKEKYGSLRFYVNDNSDLNKAKEIEPEKGIVIGEIIQDVIDTACRHSSYTCEECGKHASTRNWGGWYYTRCYDCWKILMKNQYSFDIPEKESEYQEWEETTMEKIH